MLDLSFLPWTSRIAAHNVRAKQLMNNIYCLLLVLSEDAKNPREKWLIQDHTAGGRTKLESMMGVFPLYLLALPIYSSYRCTFLNVGTYAPPPPPPTLSLSDIQMDVIPLDRFPVDSLSWSASVIHLSTALQMHKPDTWWRAPDFNYILFHSCTQFLLQLNNQVAPAMNTFCC